MDHKYSSSCIKCGACVAECPMDNEIPELLEIYDNYQDEGVYALQEAVAMGFDRHFVCINCDACLDVCPQEIPISEVLGELMDAAGDMED